MAPSETTMDHLGAAIERVERDLEEHRSEVRTEIDAIKEMLRELARTVDRRLPPSS